MNRHNYDWQSISYYVCRIALKLEYIFSFIKYVFKYRMNTVDFFYLLLRNGRPVSLS